MSHLPSTQMNTVYWQLRTTFTLTENSAVKEKIQQYLHDRDSREARKSNKLREYTAKYNISPAPTDLFGNNALIATTESLSRWAISNSWYRCEDCNSVVTVKLPHNFKVLLKRNFRSLFFSL